MFDCYGDAKITERITYGAVKIMASRINEITCNDWDVDTINPQDEYMRVRNLHDARANAAVSCLLQYRQSLGQTTNVDNTPDHNQILIALAVAYNDVIGYRRQDQKITTLRHLVGNKVESYIQ